MSNTVILMVQARMGSTRLPGKTLMPILGRPMLAYLIERLKQVKHAKEILIATTNKAIDFPIVELAAQEQVHSFRGSEDNVLARYWNAARKTKAETIVRITGDCPIIDPAVIDQGLELFFGGDTFDYVSNTIERTYPRGMEVEIFSKNALEKAVRLANLPSEREHVTPFFYQNPKLFRIGQFCYHRDLSGFRWTVDTPEDFQLISKIFETLYPVNPFFNLEDIVSLMELQPNLVTINQNVRQKEL